MRPGVAVWCALVAGFGVGGVEARPAEAKARPAVARATFLEGQVEYLPRAARFLNENGPTTQAPWRSLNPKARLRAGDAVRTGRKARVELTFNDRSKVRLDAGTTLTLTQAYFRPDGQRRVSLKVWIGRLWAKVAHRLGDHSSFEVTTRNAVAGVRGTSFVVLAQADLSSVVKVYTGTVGVKKNGAQLKKGRVEVAGPKRVDRRQWEEVIATAKRQVRVTQLGEIQPAEDFVDDGVDEAWAQWNKARDRRTR